MMRKLTAFKYLYVLRWLWMQMALHNRRHRRLMNYRADWKV